MPRDTYPPHVSRRPDLQRRESIAFPFTIEVRAKGGHVSAPPVRSWGDRIGLWWEDPDPGAAGVIVADVMPSSPAQRSGGIMGGDVVVEVHGAPVQVVSDITRQLDACAPGAIRFMLRRPPENELHTVVLEVPAPVQPGPKADPSAPLETTAAVVRTDLRTSIHQHIQCILSNPVQSDIHLPGVAADPDFGCLGADLEFSVERVGHAAMTRAIERCEHRITELSISNIMVDVETRAGRESHPGIRVDAKLAVGGEPIRLDFEIGGLAERRSARRRSLAGERADGRTP